MTSNPFDSGELGRTDPELDRVGQRLEQYAAEAGGQPPLDLAARVRAAVDLEPVHGRGFMHWLHAHSGPVTAMAAAAALVAVVAGALAIGQLVDRTQDRVGTSPSPQVVVTPAPTPSPTPTPSPSPTSSPSPSERPSETVAPSGTDDQGGTETPEPSESDHGGSDNSGSGGGGSGSGSGSSGSGSGEDGP